MKCPNCGGFFSLENDTTEDYLLCGICAREFDMELRRRRMTPQELEARYGITLKNKDAAIWEENEIL